MDKPKLKRDWEGRSVKLLREITTNGGRIFGAGTIMLVERNYNGLHLAKREVCQHCGCGHEHKVNRVSESSVELL